MALSDRLESLREQLQQKKQDRKQQREERRERIKQNQPEGAREEIRATGRQARFLAAELGVSRSRATQIVDQGNELLTQAAKAGDDALKALDDDNDGDTDILQRLESGATDSDGFGSPKVNEPTGQRGSGQQSKQRSKNQRTDERFDSDAMQDPLRGGIESEIGLDYSDLEQQVDVSNIEDDMP